MNLEIIPELVEELEISTRKALQDFKETHNETFYYCSLITDGLGNWPFLMIWTKEALERALEDEEDPEEARYYIEWSYADSPYLAYGEKYFDKVKEIIYDKRAEFNDSALDFEELDKEFQLRINSMEKVMFNLDKEGWFGTGEERLGVVINAEVVPPDYGNTERALRLNPIEALTVWLDEVAESEEEE